MVSRIDDSIEKISPAWAARRAAARHDLQVIKAFHQGGVGRGGYAGGNRSTKRKEAAFNRSRPATEDAVAAGSLKYMQLEAMDLYRNNPLAKALVDTTKRYCRQSVPRANSAAFVPENQKDAAKEWDRQATQRFNDFWWNRADSKRRPGVTFGTMQEFFINTQFTQGDLAFVWKGDGWDVVEGLQIQTPAKLLSDRAIKRGFRINGKGRMTHMYFVDYHDGSTLFKSQYFTRVNMRSVVFCPWYWRAAAIRSVPRMHGVVDGLRDQEEIHEFIKLKVKHEASLISIEKAGSRVKAPGSKLTNADKTTTTFEKNDYGMRISTTGKPGEDFLIADGNTPNVQHVPFMEYDGMMIAAAVGLPWKAVMAIYDNSWSSNKAVQAALKVFCNEIWKNRRDVFTQRAWNVMISDDIRTGALDPAPVNQDGISQFFRVDWSLPFFPQFDQAKEETGRSNAWQNMTQSLDDFADEQGTTKESLLARHKSDMEELQRDAKSLGIPIEVYAAGLLSKTSTISLSRSEQSVSD